MVGKALDHVFGDLTVCSRFALAALLLLALTACDSGSSGTSPEGLRVQIYSAPQASDPFAGVGVLHLRVDGPDLGAGISTLVPYTPGSGAGLIDKVPFSGVGATRQVVVEGWTADAAGQPDVLVSRGKSVTASVQEDFPSQALTVLLARTNAFVPMTDAVTRQSQSLLRGRLGHSAVLTARDEVVIAGGGTLTAGGAKWWTGEGLDSLTNTIELVDTLTNVARPRTGTLVFDRVWHTGTALPDGRVLIAGGWVNDPPAVRPAADHVEVIDPRSDEPAKVLAQRMAKPRAGHSATLIDPETFTVLFVGGDTDGNPTFEVWDPFNGSPLGARPIIDNASRRFHAAEAFQARNPANPSGPSRPAVLIVGGESPTEPLASALVYDITSDTMIVQPGGLTKGARTQLAATFVPAQGKIYITGGFTTLDRSGASNAIDVYDVNAATPEQAFLTSISGFNLAHPRGAHTATLMDDDSVLIAGGARTGAGSEPTIEIIHQFFKQEIDPATGQAVLKPFITVAFACDDPSCPDVPALPEARFGHRAVALESGMVLMTGGVSGVPGAFVHVPELSLYNPQ